MVKSNAQHKETLRNEVDNANALTDQLKTEKDALVSMFLANATISELAAQYKLIDELNAQINKSKQGPVTG